MIAVSQYMTSVTESECGQNNLFVTELEENPYDLPPKKVSVDKVQWLLLLSNLKFGTYVWSKRTNGNQF